MYQKLVKLYRNDDFWRKASLMFITSIFVNGVNFFYYFLMARTLSTIHYGILNSLLSLFMIISLPIGAFQIVITKFTAQFHGLEQHKKIRLLYLKSFKIIFYLALVFVVIFVFCSPLFAAYLKIKGITLFFLLSLLMGLSFFKPILSGTMQGLQRFKEWSIVMAIAGIAKIFLSYLLVYFGLGTHGALLGFGSSDVVCLLLALYLLRLYQGKVRQGKSREPLKILPIYKHYIPVILGILCFTILINFHVILVKHYFKPLEVGYYSLAQIPAKVVLFFPGAIVAVMLPKVSFNHAKNGENLPLLKKSLTGVGILSAIVVVFCITFPRLILKVVTGKIIPEVIPLIRFFVVAVSVFSLVQVLLYYSFSTYNLSLLIFFVIVTFLQIGFIIMFHESLLQILCILFCSSLILFLIGLWIFFYKERRPATSSYQMRSG